MKLNLGCSKKIMEGWINVDISKLPGVDIIWDLNKFPYPFKDDSADYILMDNVLEHLLSPLDVLAECHRILKPRGKIEIDVPHFRWISAYSDPTHSICSLKTRFCILRIRRGISILITNSNTK